MFGVNYRFSSIVLNEFAMPAEGRPINAHGVSKAGDRAPKAHEMLQMGVHSTVWGEDTFWSVQTMASHSACVLAESRRCFPDLGRGGGIRQKGCVINSRVTFNGIVGVRWGLLLTSFLLISRVVCIQLIS
ncbi:hypothetical protein EDD22DRAFT_953179 [Suillus occidentalis]|nr:hypothetical protein EDD22DRAFT_953179 [Suillus occidentalis]